MSPGFFLLVRAGVPPSPAAMNARAALPRLSAQQDRNGGEQRRHEVEEDRARLPPGAVRRRRRARALPGRRGTCARHEHQHNQRMREQSTQTCFF